MRDRPAHFTCKGSLWHILARLAFLMEFCHPIRRASRANLHVDKYNNPCMGKARVHKGKTFHLMWSFFCTWWKLELLLARPSLWTKEIKVIMRHWVQPDSKWFLKFNDIWCGSSWTHARPVWPGKVTLVLLLQAPVTSKYFSRWKFRFHDAVAGKCSWQCSHWPFGFTV